MSFYNGDFDISNMMDKITDIQIYSDDIEVKLSRVIYDIKLSNETIAEAKIIAQIANDNNHLTILYLQRVKLIEIKLEYEKKIEHCTNMMKKIQSRMLDVLN